MLHFGKLSNVALTGWQGGLHQLLHWPQHRHFTGSSCHCSEQQCVHATLGVFCGMQGNVRLGSPMASMPEYALRFVPPLVIRNCLPYEVPFLIY